MPFFYCFLGGFVLGAFCTFHFMNPRRSDQSSQNSEGGDNGAKADKNEF